MSLRLKLIAGFGLVSLLIWISTYSSIELVKRSITEQFVTSNAILAEDILRKTDEYIHNKIVAFQDYSLSPLLQDQLQKANSELASSFSLATILNEELKGRMRHLNEKHGFRMIDEIFVTNMHGSIIGSTGPIYTEKFDEKAWWQESLNNGIHVQDMSQHPETGNFSVNVSMRVDDLESQFIGIMRFAINIEGVINILKTIPNDARHKHHKTMIFTLLTSNGRVIYSNNGTNTFMSKLENFLPEEGDLSNASQMIMDDFDIPERNGDDDVFIVHSHSTGYSDYKGLGWILAIEHHADDVLAPVSGLINWLLIISSLVTAVAGLIGFAISSRVTNSARKLRDAAVNIGKGDLDTVIDIRSRDEIGQLAETFQLMTDNLKSTTVRLDEFAREVADRKETEELLIQSRQDWMDTFNTITDAITIHDKNYNIIRANKAAQESLKLPPTLIGNKATCYKHYHGTDSPPPNCPSCDCLKTGKPTVFEIFEPHLNMYVEIRSIPRFDSSGELVGLIHVVRDISERKKTEDLIQTQLERLNALRSIDKAIIGSIDLRVSLDIFLTQVVAQLKIDAATVLIYNKKTQLLEYIVSKGFRTTALKHTKLRLGDSYAGKAARERQILSVPNLADESERFAMSEHFLNEKFVSYIAVPLIAKGKIKGVLELFHRSPLETDADWMGFLEAIADQGAIAADNATLFSALQKSNMELTLAYDNTIEGWSRAMDLRDKETEGHSQRVAEMTTRIADEMGVGEEKIVHMRRGALLHDIGKIGVSDSVLLKTGPLTEDEWRLMKQHPAYAYEMLYPIEYLRPVIDIPYCHHEKWDGTGYPRGLKGDSIPLAARIFAIVDVWDALNSDRPYRKNWPAEKIYDHIRSLSGTHFDPDVVDIFLKIMKQDVESEVNVSV